MRMGDEQYSPMRNVIAMSQDTPLVPDAVPAHDAAMSATVPASSTTPSPPASTVLPSSQVDTWLAEIASLAATLVARITATIKQIGELAMSGATGASGQIAALATDVAALSTAVTSLENGYQTLLAEINSPTSTLDPADAASLTASINTILSTTQSAVAALAAGATGATGATGDAGTTGTTSP